MGKDGNELKYQFQKFSDTVHLHFFSSEWAWWLWTRTEDSQRQYSEWPCEQWGGITEEQASAGSPLPTNRWMLYSWGRNSPAAEVNKTLLSILAYHICILLFNLMLCCTDKLVFPLSNHTAVGKDACPRRLWLVSCPQPPVMLSESKTGTGHLLLYQLLFNRNHLFITKQHI